MLFGGFTPLQCAANFEYMMEESDDAGWIVDLVLNRDWAPDSVGHTIQACIEDGWTEWRKWE